MDRLDVLIDVLIEGGDWTRLDGVEALVQRAAATVLNPDQDATVLLTDDAALQRLNKQFRGIDKPTNVLSFGDDDPEREDTVPGDNAPGGPSAYLGDIAIAWQTVAREALDEGKRLEDHLSHLVIHGCLHLLGDDHETDSDAARMEAKERAALATLGIADPYGQDDPDMTTRDG